MIRASLYLRISVSTDESTSLDRQEADLRALAARLGADVVAVHTDDGLSGARADRPGLAAWLADATDGRADLLLVWDFTRLSREGLAAAARVIDALDSSGARLVSVRDALDSSSAAFRLVAAVLSETARAERESIRARVRSTVAHLPTVGRFAGGVVPYGYRTAPAPDGSGRVLELDPAEAAVVRELAERVLAGESLYSLCQDLNRRGVAPRRAASWGASSLRWLLTSDAILGRATVGGSGRAGDAGHRRGSVLLGADGLPVELWPPVLDVETVERLRAALAPRREQPRRKRAARLASGLLRCASCSTVLVLKTTRDRRGSAVVSYVCPTRNRGGLCSAPVSVKAEAVEAELAARFLAELGDRPELVRVERVRTVAGLAAVEEALRLAGDAITRPGADVAGLAARIAELSARRDQLATLPAGTVVELHATDRTLGEAWQLAELAGRRSMLADALLSATVAPAGPVRAWRPERLAVVWSGAELVATGRELATA